MVQNSSANTAPWRRSLSSSRLTETTVSSDEGLEQEFNSLDAQREACEAYITSQRHAGWVAVPDMYDDGGLSGGTMERPALQRLLTDIKVGKVQIVVVYKVDRLTRSLADFAKIVDVFDAHDASFVSVTQQFNTTTSMGRLTLNMLLSFAQFEREIAGERIRDKIAASKAKGMWMGGTEKARLRRGDIAVRYGGEEFLAVLLDVDLNTASKVADDVRRMIEVVDFSDLGPEHMTVSIGVAPVLTNIGEAVSCADRSSLRRETAGP